MSQNRLLVSTCWPWPHMTLTLFFRLPDSWVTERTVETQHKRIIPLTDLPQQSMLTLHPSFYSTHRYRKHRRKWTPGGAPQRCSLLQVHSSTVASLVMWRHFAVLSDRTWRYSATCWHWPELMDALRVSSAICVLRVGMFDSWHADVSLVSLLGWWLSSCSNDIWAGNYLWIMEDDGYSRKRVHHLATVCRMKTVTEDSVFMKLSETPRVKWHKCGLECINAIRIHTNSLPTTETLKMSVSV